MVQTFSLLTPMLLVSNFWKPRPLPVYQHWYCQYRICNHIFPSEQLEQHQRLLLLLCNSSGKNYNLNDFKTQENSSTLSKYFGIRVAIRFDVCTDSSEGLTTAALPNNKKNKTT